MKMNNQILIGLSLLLFQTTTFALDQYQQDCHVIGEDDYVKYTISLDPDLKQETDFILKLTAYEDENCHNPYLNYTQNFKIKKYKNLKIDLLTEKVSYTALTEETADALNLIHYCQKQNWIPNQELDVTGLKCDDFIQKAKNEMYYQILKLNINELLWGEITPQTNGQSDLKRPLDFGLKFTKIFTKPGLHVNRIPLK